MISLQRKSMQVSGWHLTDQSQMLDALSILSAAGWRGAISFDAASMSWALELNADDPVRQIMARTGDWLVVDAGLRKLTTVQVLENYEVEGS